MYALNIPTEHDGIISKPRGSWAKFCSHFLGSMASCISVLGVKKSESMDCRKTNVIRTFGSLQYSCSTVYCRAVRFVSIHFESCWQKSRSHFGCQRQDVKQVRSVFFSEVIFGFLGLPFCTCQFLRWILKRDQSPHSLLRNLAAVLHSSGNQKLTSAFQGWSLEWNLIMKQNGWQQQLVLLLSLLPFKTLATPLHCRAREKQWLWDLRTRPQTSLKITQKELSEHSTTSSLWLSIGGVVPWRISKAELLHKCLKRHVMVQNMQVKQFQSRHDSSSRAAQ